MKSTFSSSSTSAWSPRERLLATASLDGGFEDAPAELTIHRVDVASDALTRVKTVKLPSGRFGSLAWGLDNLLAGGMTDGSLRFFQADSLDQVGQVSEAHTKGSAIRACVFNPHADHKNLVATGGADKQVLITDLSRGFAGLVSKPPFEGAPVHQAEVTALAWNSESSLILASASADGTIIVWDLRSRKLFCEIRDPRGQATTALAWNPKQGLQLLAGSDGGTLRMYDLQSSKTTPLAELLGHTGGVFDVSWCPHDANLVASCAKDNSLILWDVEYGCELQRIQDEAQPKLRAEAVFAPAPAAAGNSRRYQIDWSPTLRGLLSACSFDRSVSVIGLIAGGIKTRLPRAPAWFRRPCRARMGFGAQLVRSLGKGGLEIEPVHVTRLGERARQFEAQLDSALRHDQSLQSPAHEHMVAFCHAQALHASNVEEQEVWRFMPVLFGDKSRIGLQAFLGYDDSSVERAVDYSFLPEEDSPQQQQQQSQGPDAAEDDVDALVTRALIGGNFKAAVALCFQHGRDADGLMLSALGGPGLVRQAQLAYLGRQTRRPLMRVAETIWKADMNKSLADTDLSKPGAWKQTLASVSTVAEEMEFSGVAAALGARLEAEKDGQAAATICYMLARNVPKCVELWSKSGASDSQVCERALVFQNVLMSREVLTGDATAMAHFARLALALADDGEMDVATKYAAMASGCSAEAAALLVRLFRANPERIGAILGCQPYVPWQQVEVNVAVVPQPPPPPPQQQQQQQPWGGQQQQWGGQWQQSSQQQWPAAPAQPSWTQSQAKPPAVYSQAPPPPQSSFQAAANYPPAAAYQPAYHPPPAQPAYQPPPPAQPAYQPPPPAQPAYQPPPPAQPAYQPPQPAYQSPQPAYQPPPPAQPAYQPPQPAYQPSQPAYQPPPAQQQPPPSTYQAYPANAQAGYHPNPSWGEQHLPPPPPQQQWQQDAPRIRENDGFVTTAGNPALGAKFGNRGAEAPPPVAPPKPPAKIPDAMLPVLAQLDRAAAEVGHLQLSSMDERQHKEALKGLEALKAAMLAGSVSDHVQSKVAEMAAAIARKDGPEATRIQVALTSTDWADCKEWLKGLRHLIALAAKPSEPPSTFPPGAYPPAPHAYPPPPAYGGPPMQQQQQQYGKPPY